MPRAEHDDDSRGPARWLWFAGLAAVLLLLCTCWLVVWNAETAYRQQQLVEGGRKINDAITRYFAAHRRGYDFVYAPASLEVLIDEGILKEWPANPYGGKMTPVKPGEAAIPGCVAIMVCPPDPSDSPCQEYWLCVYGPRPLWGAHVKSRGMGSGEYAASLLDSLDWLRQGGVNDGVDLARVSLYMNQGYIGGPDD